VLRNARLIFERQGLHAVLLAILVALFALTTRFDAVRAGSLFGVGTLTWAWIAVAVPVAHQLLVWFVWRTQLHESLMTDKFGSRAFAMYAAAFALLGIGRVVMVVLVALSNQATVTASGPALKIVAAACAAVCLYTFWSVKRYFGFRRALGIDHFDPAARSWPLVRRGIFRFTSNGMYVFGFLLIWIPGLWCASAAALCVALFNHLYIWVHFVCTERPDMRRIYES